MQPVINAYCLYVGHKGTASNNEQPICSEKVELLNQRTLEGLVLVYLISLHKNYAKATKDHITIPLSIDKTDQPGQEFKFDFMNIIAVQEH